MRIPALLAVVLALAAPCRADVTDSGNLLIGGQGVIGGTMTVQGSAFSVGGSTFTVAEGSVTLGGRLNAAAAGIKWADGTTSTTSSSSGGGGDAVLIATQTFSGANTFLSTLTINGTSNVCDGGGIAIASGSFNGAFNVSLPSLSLTSRTFHIDFVFQTTVNVNGLNFWMNGSSTKLYSQAGVHLAPFNGTSIIENTGSDNSAYAVVMGGASLTVSARSSTLGRGVTGRCIFQGSTAIIWQGFCDWNYFANASDSLCNTSTFCGYRTIWNANLTSALTQINFCANTDVPMTAFPNCTKPLYGYWKLCGDGWNSN